MVALFAAPALTFSGLTPVAGVVATAAFATAIGAAGVVTAMAPAKAAVTCTTVLVFPNSVNGGSSSREASEAASLGCSVTMFSMTMWNGLTQQQQNSYFGQFQAIIVGDPSATTCSTTVPSDALATASYWGSAIDGNAAVLGTAPSLAISGGAGTTLLDDAISYAIAAGSSDTGLYASLNCEYSGSAAGTSVPLLASVDGGGFTVTGQGSFCSADAGTVNTWQALALTQFNGLTSANLGPWPSPACAVEETFNAWPAALGGLAYGAANSAGTGFAAPGTFTASDGATGQAFILAGTPISSGTAALTPTSGGQVPPGSTSGGSNPAAPGVVQAQSDGVDTETGDFSQSNDDFSIQTFGPSLAFSRSYDTQVAQEQTQTGTPGPMGYGWTDNWASSLSTVSPVVGNVYSLDGLATPNGNGGPATGGPLDYPDMSILNNGNVYISDTAGNRIEEIPKNTGTQWGISMTAGDMYTIAGSPTGAYEVHPTPDGTPDEAGVNGATAPSLLNHPEGIAFDSSGDLYIADTDDNRVVEVPVASGNGMTADDLYNVAGNSGGSSGSSGDGSAATSAFLDGPVGLDFGRNGSDLYIADAGNNRIQEVPAENGGQWGQTSMTADDMYTVAGSVSGTPGASPNGTAAENANGQGAASLLDGPEGLTFSGTGDMYIADTTNSRIVEIPKASGTQWGTISMTADDVYTVAGSQANGTQGTSGDGGVATSALLNLPVSLQADNGGQLYISDSGNNRIQEVAATGHTEWNISMTADDIYTIAGSANGTAGFSGDGGLATAALLNNPGQIGMDGSLNMYIPDTNNNREREVSASTYKISEFAGDGQTLASMGDGGPAIDGELFRPAGQAEDASGNIYIADGGNNRVQEIAATTHTQWGINMTAGDVYTVAGSAYGLGGYSGDSGLATSALLDSPAGIAVDAAGDLFIADRVNNVIREVNAATGKISTIAGNGTDGISGNGGPATSAELENPQNVAVDSFGDVFIADNLSNEVREVFASGGRSYGQAMTAGDIYLLAGSPSGAAGTSGDGGPPTSALLNEPRGVAVDGVGNLYIADTLNNRIQEIPVSNGLQRGQQMTKYDIYTVAGSATGTSGHSGDGGAATAALLWQPYGLASDAAGDLFIADGQNNRVQEVPAANGTQWGTSMTANDMYTVVGSASGTKGETGDGGPAVSALMSFAIDVSVDSQGNLYISDWAGNHLREVAATSTTTITAAPGQASALYPAPGSTVNGTTYPAGVTITQSDGSQVTFYPIGSGCVPPYGKVASDQYCTLPQYVHANLSYSGGTFTYSPDPSQVLTYNSAGYLSSEADEDGDTLTITYGTVLPGQQNCPSTANWCEVITSASARTLTIGYNATNLVTSVTDPMGRQWTYGYTTTNRMTDLTSATDPMGRETTYTYDTGNSLPLLGNDMLTITPPNGQSGGPNAGKAVSLTYDASGRVTSETDPMGNATTYAWSGFNQATGNGVVRVGDPDGNTTVYYYVQGNIGAQSAWTGTTLTSEQDFVPDQIVAGSNAGTQLTTMRTDANGNISTASYSGGNMVSENIPDGETNSNGTTQSAMVTQSSTSSDLEDCSSQATAAETCTQDPPPNPVTSGQAITPPSVPASGVAWTGYDNLGNSLYTTVSISAPGSNSVTSQQTTYHLYKGNSVTLNGQDITCTYTPAPPSPSLPCATIGQDGLVTQYGYDSQGDLVYTATPDGNGSQLAVTTDTYDADGEQTSEVSPDGNVTGGNPGNYTTATTYDADGEDISETGGGGSGHTVTPRTYTSGYDADGNQTTATDALGYTTTTSYNADGEPTMVTDPDQNSTLTCYDGDGNVAQTVPAVGVAANHLTPADCPTSYPAAYNPNTASNWLASDATLNTYDALGNNTDEYTPLPHGQTGPPNYETTASVFDSNGNLLEQTKPSPTAGGSSAVTTYTYNSNNDVTSATSGSGSSASTIAYCYDPDGDNTSVVYPDGNGFGRGLAPCQSAYPWNVSASGYPSHAAYQTTYAYNSLQELASITRPATTATGSSGGVTSFSYDTAGQVVGATDPNGVTSTMTYTPTGQPASVSFSGNSAPPISYSYDAEGTMTSMSDGSGTTSYNYDPFGELASQTNGAGQTTSYGYDADGNVTSIGYPLPTTATWATSDSVTFSYDHAGMMTGVTDFNGHTITIGNTADGLPDSLGLASTGDTISTTYDPTDTPDLIKLTNASSTLESFSYSDGPAGDILSESDAPNSSQSPTYTYDSQGRVTSMTPGSGSPLNYGFDPSGNLATLPNKASPTYDDASELTSATAGSTTTNYTYDADGNRLAAQQGGTTVVSATWNGAGQLTAYSDAAAMMANATYDANGLRASATFTPAGGSPGTQNYVWDGDNLLMDSVNAYVYAGGTTPAEQVNLTTGASTYLVTDALGSVRCTVNPSGILTGTTSYDAWGNPETPGGLTSTTPFGYAGGYTDPDGLIYLISRYYDPATGQFTSLDPDVDDTLDPYGYTAGDPVNSTDPTGQQVCKGRKESCRFDYQVKVTYDYIEDITRGRHGKSGPADIIIAGMLCYHNNINCPITGGQWGGLIEALIAFGNAVRAGGTWDADKNLTSDTDKRYREQYEYLGYVRDQGAIISHLWVGNMVFGYVGRYFAFSAWMLQVGGELADKYLSCGSGCDNAGNWIMRQAGIDLYHSHPKYATTGDIKNEVFYEMWSLPAGGKFANTGQVGLLGTGFGCVYSQEAYKRLVHYHGQYC